MDGGYEAYSEGGFTRESFIRGRCFCVARPNDVDIISFDADGFDPLADFCPHETLQRVLEC